MKKLLLLSVLTFGLTFFASAQWRVAGGVNVLTTPFFENVPKYIFGAEVNYFMQSSFALTGGLEFIEKDLGASVGARYYPINPVFVRARGILNANSDFALGMGYAVKLNRNLRVETMGDYFAVSNGFAIRVGLGLSLR